MARNSHKHQRKIAKQKAKRQSRKRDLAKRQSIGIEGQLARAGAAPILDCLAPDDIWQTGIGQVLISRELPNQQVAVAVFLVDVWCLGVKDAMAKIMPKSEYREGIYAGLHDQFDMRRQSPEVVRQLVEGAVAYAAQFGLSPHADYRPAKAIFGAIDPTLSGETFQFGQDGLPHYCAGPYESAEESRWIIRRLAEHAGEGNYHFTLPVAAELFERLGGRFDELEFAGDTSEEEDDEDVEYEDVEYEDDEYEDDEYEQDTYDEEDDDDSNDEQRDSGPAESPAPDAKKSKPFGWLSGWFK